MGRPPWRCQAVNRQQILAVSGVTAVAQLAGFLKLWVIARQFGVGAELDGYNLAFVGPTLIVGVVAGALPTGLFPVYTALRVRHGSTAVESLERLVFWHVLAWGTAISLALFVLSEPAADLLAAGAAPAVREATAQVLRFSALSVVFSAIGDYLASVLALRGRYIAAAAAPIANAIVGMAALLVWPEGRLTSLAAGTLLGVALQTGIIFVSLSANGFAVYHRGAPRVDLRAESRRIKQLAGWILPGTIVANLSGAIPPLLLVEFGDGAVSAFGYAYKFHLTTVQLLVMAISPMLLAHFSELVAKGHWLELESIQHRSLRATLLIGAIFIAVIWIAGTSLLDLALGHGSFDSSAAARVQSHWLWLTFGLTSALHGAVLAKRLQAHGRARDLSALALAGLVILVVVFWALRPLLSETAAPAAVAAGTTATCIAMVTLIRRLGRER